MQQHFSASQNSGRIDASSFQSGKEIFRATYTIRLPGMRLKVRARHDELFSLLRALRNSSFFGA